MSDATCARPTASRSWVRRCRRPRAAYVASRTAHVTLFEADTRLGGHADTHTVPDRRRPRTSRSTPASSSTTSAPTRRCCASSPSSAWRPSRPRCRCPSGTTRPGWSTPVRSGPAASFPPAATWRDRRTCGCSSRSRASTDVPAPCSPPPRTPPARAADETLREFLARGRFTAYFQRHFMEPLVAAVWSCDPDLALDYPARYLFSFLHHHGMLGVFGSPQWRTVTGGSRDYVDGSPPPCPTSASAPRSPPCSRRPTGSRSPTATARPRRYDAVVVATHPDQALAMLAEPTDAARRARRDAVLRQHRAAAHRHPRCCPRRAPGRRGTSSGPSTTSGGVTVTYDLTRLQRLRPRHAYLVTLGGERPRRPRHGHRRRWSTTTRSTRPARLPRSAGCPRSTPAARLRRRLPRLGLPRGRCALRPRRRRRLGFDWPDGRARHRSSPARAGRRAVVYATTIRHTRRPPFRHGFTHRRTAGWSTSTTCPRRGVPRARSRPATTSARPTASIRENVDAFLATTGVDLRRRPGADGSPTPRARLLLQPDQRVLVPPTAAASSAGGRSSRCTTPTATGTPTSSTPTRTAGPTSTRRCTSRPSTASPAATRCTRPSPADALHVAVTLHPTRAPPFSASLVGEPRDRRPPLRAALSPLSIALRIRLHGIRLWLRRLPVRPRPTTTDRRVCR